MRLAFKGMKDYVNESAPLLMEFNQKRRLAELGYRFRSEDLPAWKAEAFALISATIQELEQEDIKSSSKKG